MHIRTSVARPNIFEPFSPVRLASMVASFRAWA